MIVKCFFLLLCCTNSLSFFEETHTDDENDVWENPHDSFVESKSYVFDEEDISECDYLLDGTEITLPDKAPPLKRPLKRACTEPNLKPKKDACPSFLSRFINIILENTGLKNYYMRPSENVKTVTIDISVTQKTLKTLQKFNAGEKVRYHDLDESFVTFFEFFKRNDKTNKPSDDYVEPNSFHRDSEASSSFFYSMEHNQVIILVTSICLLVFIIFILRNGLKINSIVVLLSILYYIIRVCQILWTQYEDIYAERIITLEESLDNSGSYKIPDECFPQKTSFMTKIYYNIFSKDDPCKRYLKSKKSIFSELDIELAITKPILGLLYSSIVEFGDSAGKATHSFTGYFSTFMQPIILFMVIYCFFTCLFNVGLSQIMSLLFSFNPIHFIGRSYPQLNNGASPQGILPPQPPPPTAPTVVNNFNFTHPPFNGPSLSSPGTSNNVTQKENFIGFAKQEPENNFAALLPHPKLNKIRKRNVFLVNKSRRRVNSL